MPVCRQPTYAVPVATPACGCNSTRTPAAETADRLRSEFQGMPGLRSVGLYTAPRSSIPYVIAGIGGPAAWRIEQMSRGMGRHSNGDSAQATYKTDRNKVTVIFQKTSPAAFDLNAPSARPFIDKLKADPRYQSAVRDLANATSQSDSWRKARSFIDSDAFVREVYRTEPNARFDTPPAAPSVFHACGTYGYGRR